MTDRIHARKAGPTGILVGWKPSSWSNRDTPLWPDPAEASGGRLLALSGLDRQTYLDSFARVNLVYDFVAKTDRAAQQSEARRISPLLTLPTILLGREVQRGFELNNREYFEWARVPVDRMRTHYQWVCTIPHSSGLNRAYLDRTVVEAARLTLQAVAHGRLCPEVGGLAISGPTALDVLQRVRDSTYHGPVTRRDAQWHCVTGSVKVDAQPGPYS